MKTKKSKRTVLEAYIEQVKEATPPIQNDIKVKKKRTSKLENQK